MSEDKFSLQLMVFGEYGAIGVHVLHLAGKEECLGLGRVIVHSHNMADQVVTGMALLYRLRMQTEESKKLLLNDVLSSTAQVD